MNKVKGNTLTLFSPTDGLVTIRPGVKRMTEFRKPTSKVRFSMKDWNVMLYIAYATDAIAWIPRQFLNSYDFKKDADMLRLFLIVRMKAANDAGYFCIKQLEKEFPCTNTRYRLISRAISIGLIEKIIKGKYKITSLYKQPIREKQRGHYGLTAQALECKEYFKAWIVSATSTQTTREQKAIQKKLGKFKSASRRAKKIDELLNGSKSECYQKERRSTRAKLQQFEGDNKILPRQIQRLCYQSSDEENVGFVSCETLADKLDISAATASRYRLKAARLGMHKLELQSKEISEYEARYAPYMQFFAGRIYKQDGKFRVRMTSKVTCNIKTNSKKAKFRSLVSISLV
jgi:hypothetical protein